MAKLTATAGWEKDLRIARSYTVDSTTTIPAYKKDVTVSFSFYCSCNYYRTFTWRITMTCNGTNYTKDVTMTTSSNRFNVTGSWEIDNKTSSAWTITGFTIQQISPASGSPTSDGVSYNRSETDSTVSVSGGSTYYTDVGTPTGLSLSSNNVLPNTSVTLSWNASSGGINTSVSKYYIYRNGSYLDQTTGTSINVTSPSSNGGTYTYTVKAIANVSGYDSGTSSGVTLTTVWGGLSAPTNLSIDDQYAPPSTTTTLRWDAVSNATNNTVTGYTVFKGETALGTTQTTSYSITSETSGTATYYVRANGSVANSSNSSGITLYTYTAPTAPTASLSATEVSPGVSVTLSWSGAADGDYNAITGYEIYRSSSATTGFTKVGNTLATNVSSLAVDAPATQGATYYYKVRVLGTRGSSSADSDTVHVSTYTYRQISAPTSLLVSPTTVPAGGSATLTWNAGTGTDHVNVSSYQVWRCTTQNGTYVQLGNNTTLLTMTVYGPDSGSYYYKVQAIADVSGYDSDLSSVIAVLSANAAPTVPNNFSVSPADYNDGNLIFSWSASTDPEGDSVFYRITMVYGGSTTTVAEDIVTTSYTVDLTDTIVRGTSATFYCYAYDSNGSTSSASASVTVSRVEAASSTDIELQNYSGNVCYSEYPKLIYKAKRRVKVSATGWTASSNGFIEVNDMVILTCNTQKVPASTAVADRLTVTVNITITDQYNNTATATQSITVALPDYCDDPAAQDSYVKAAHVTNLRTIIATHYKFITGQNLAAWTSGDVTAGVTSLALWSTHVSEMRTAIESIVNYFNNLVGNVIITSPSWQVISENKPRASVMNQIWTYLRDTL